MSPAAVMVSAGIGVFVLGLLTTLAVPWGDLKEFLAHYQAEQGAGPLAGETTVAVIARLLTRGGLHPLDRRRRRNRLQEASSFDLRNDGLGIAVGEPIGLEETTHRDDLVDNDPGEPAGAGLGSPRPISQSVITLFLIATQPPTNPFARLTYLPTDSGWFPPRSRQLDCPQAQPSPLRTTGNQCSPTDTAITIAVTSV